jgi:hypothetical protein
MIRLIRYCLLSTAFACAPAFANFHLWQISELYSSPDGKVQFVELRALLTGQQFLTGHSISADGSAGSHSFEFDHDLAGDTSGRTMLIGTQSFANLHIVAPDYIVTDNFFSLGSGTINFGPQADVWNYANLPTNNNSLDRSGATGTNSPRNFAGATGTVPASVPAPTIFNVQALWWNDPDASEGGWGINITHQSNTLFVAWFTYDADGKGMWLFMSDASMSATIPNTYTGTILRATGAPFSAYDPAQFKNSPVGSGTFTFTDAGHGTFTYTVNGITQTKHIKRFDFGTPPTCDQSAAAATNFTDLWWRSPDNSESGWGVNLVQQGNIIFMSWFTYGADGKDMWLYASSLQRTTGNTFTGELVRNTGQAFSTSPWNNANVHAGVVGTATFTFSDTSNGTFAYTADGVTQTKPIKRFVYATPTTKCR